MRFCPRCSNWKPDACFAKGGAGENLGCEREDSPPGAFFKKCGQCRAERPCAGAVPVMGPMKLPLSRETRRLILTARREAAKFRRRGARVILRPYTLVGPMLVKEDKKWPAHA